MKRIARYISKQIPELKQSKVKMTINLTHLMAGAYVVDLVSEVFCWGQGVSVFQRKFDLLWLNPLINFQSWSTSRVKDAGILNIICVSSNTL